MYKFIVELNLLWIIIVFLGNLWWYEIVRVVFKVIEVFKKFLIELYCIIIINIIFSKFVELEVIKVNKY